MKLPIPLIWLLAPSTDWVSPSRVSMALPGNWVTVLTVSPTLSQVSLPMTASPTMRVRDLSVVSFSQPT
ncbi:hypothetical protein [Bacteroides xylanisolvens]|uniref:hypothetical protein n=1 Tax=Bacteroides xylanisolvens TaxID=371601 RepID=UPI0035176935